MPPRQEARRDGQTAAAAHIRLPLCRGLPTPGSGPPTAEVLVAFARSAPAGRPAGRPAHRRRTLPLSFETAPGPYLTSAKASHNYNRFLRQWLQGLLSSSLLFELDIRRRYKYNNNGLFFHKKTLGNEEGYPLVEVVIGEHESFEAALRRFNKKVQQENILTEARRREHYEKPSVTRKKKEAAKRRKSIKTTLRNK